ncbi:DUF1015 domain-containing protein [Candidatus Sumerlaeota bacterium]|nr:DUF1015 domain-containing protein [Candidatus Sumerlaeota bacterium]
MTEVIPFISTRFNPRDVPDLGLAIAPPYDEITPELRDILYARHPYNIVRIVNGKCQAGDDAEHNRYIRASNEFNEWKAKLVLLEDEKVCYKIYEMEHAREGGAPVKLRGFIGLVRLGSLGKDDILPHLQTFLPPKTDRLRLYKAVQANLCPITMLYNNPEGDCEKLLDKAAKGAPEHEFTDDSGVTHRIWTCVNSNIIQKIRNTMRKRRLYIADGHHRYEAARKFQIDMHRQLPQADYHQPFDHILTFFIDASHQPDSTLPSHRVLCNDLGDGVELDEVFEDLEVYFDRKDLKVDLRKPKEALKQLEKALQDLPQQGFSAIMLLPDGRASALTIKEGIEPADLIDDDEIPDGLKEQTSIIIESNIIARIWLGNPEMKLEYNDSVYYHEIESVIQSLSNRKGCVAFLTRPLKFDEIIQLADDGMRLPPRSTCVFPKPASGVAIHDLQIRI